MLQWLALHTAVALKHVAVWFSGHLPSQVTDNFPLLEVHRDVKIVTMSVIVLI